MTRSVLKQLHQWPLQGTLPAREMHRVLLQVIALVGMTPAYRPVVRRYPYQAYWWKWAWNWIAWILTGPPNWFPGTGGRGYTMTQHLTESYITADVYEEDLDGWPVKQTVIILASCKDYCPAAVGLLLSELVGPLIVGEMDQGRRAWCGGGGKDVA